VKPLCRGFPNDDIGFVPGDRGRTVRPRRFLALDRLSATLVPVVYLLRSILLGAIVSLADGQQVTHPQPEREGIKTMNFGQAIEALKQGKRVSRSGWNGKGMFLILIPGSKIPVSADRPLGQAAPELVGKTIDYQPHIDMWTAQETLVPWLASQSDVLAEDWGIVA
jgi:hypothetical protein